MLSCCSSNKIRKYIVYIFLLCLFFIVLFPLACFATPNIDKVRDELNATATQLDKLGVDYNKTLIEKENLEQSIESTQQSINYNNSEITKVQDHLKVRAVELYKNNSNVLLDILVGSHDLRSLFNKIEMVKRITDNDFANINRCRELKNELEQDRNKLEQQLISVQNNITELESIQHVVSEKQNSLNLQLSELTSSERKQVYDKSEQGLPSPSPQIQPHGNDVVSRAYSMLGVPYVFGGCSPCGVDCSGLVSYCLTGQFKRIGTTHTFMSWPRVSPPVPGCVCTTDTHCGIYIGNGNMIHAPQTGDVVKISPVQSGMIYVRMP